jgi:nucleotide-binding universal stress UspA family protein
MVTPRTIIVPLDGSEFAARALPVARVIANRISADMIVMSTYWEGGVDGLAAYLDGVAKEQSGIAAEVLLVDEHPAASAIASVSRSHPESIVCMTSHGRSGARWAVLGSVTEEVVRAAHAPALLVGRHCPTDWPSHIEHLVVCVDGSNAAEPDVPAASEWAKALGLAVRVVLITHPLDVESATHPNKVVDSITERFISQGVAATAVMLRGSYVAGTIADFARTLPATLIAANTSSRRGISRVALGSVAMGVVSLAPCPVLVTPLAIARRSEHHAPDATSS